MPCVCWASADKQPSDDAALRLADFTAVAGRSRSVDLVAAANRFHGPDVQVRARRGVPRVGVLGGLVVLLGGTSWLLRRKEREQDEGESAGPDPRVADG
jgi:hypothetical protein